MLLIQNHYQGSDKASASLILNFDARTKSRLRTQLASGEEVGLFLPRGNILRGGDLLQADDGRIVAIEAAAEALTVATSTDSLTLVRAAYHLGNRHVAVEVRADSLRIQRDHVLDQMLIGLGLQLTHIDAAFEPEAGAYAPGHHHAERGATEARIHTMAR